jgi:hypothetical protein
MTTLSSLVSVATTLVEAIQFAGDLALLLLGLTAARTVLDALRRLTQALTWLAELVLLLLALVLTVTADLAPLVGRYAGRAAGTAVRLGRHARALYDAQLAPTVHSLAVRLDYTARRHVAAQLGSSCPQLQARIAPAQVLSLCIAPVEAEPATQAPMTRRALLALAKERQLPRYSRLSTDELREALTAA